MNDFNCFIQNQDAQDAVAITLMLQNDLQHWLSEQTHTVQSWVDKLQFKADPGTICYLPNAEGKLQNVLVGVKNYQDMWSVGHLPLLLPQGDYYLNESVDVLSSASDLTENCRDVACNTSTAINKNTNFPELLALGWGLGAYQFTQFKQPKRKPAKLIIPDNTSLQFLDVIRATYMTRDLINTPAESLGPEELANSFIALAKQFNADIRVTVGKDLLAANYPAIYAVGRGSSKAPRLIDLRWGDPNAPTLTLIGKGVCFDTGGLDLKSASGMLLMKKDMGGAAHVLALAYLIMQAKLPVRLRVLIPAVENSVSGDAYRPGDVIRTRKGLTIEIGNTDAEGRVILADALAEAANENPQLLIDFATLTGAARVALGPEIPVMFSNNDKIAAEILEACQQTQECIWRLPLYQPYADYIESPIADVSNNGSQPYGGAITAGLFLQKFIGENQNWVHFDLMAWNIANKPGRPFGGEAMGLRTMFEFLKKRYLD